MQEFLRITTRLSNKARSYGDVLSAPWLPRLCSYASGCFAACSHVDALLESAAVLASSEEQKVQLSAALQAVRASAGDEGTGGTLHSVLQVRHSGAVSLQAGSYLL
jgi:hypothetical protein